MILSGLSLNSTNPASTVDKNMQKNMNDMYSAFVVGIGNSHEIKSTAATHSGSRTQNSRLRSSLNVNSVSATISSITN